MENFLSRLHFNKKILLELLILLILLGLIVFIVFKYYRAKTLINEKPVEQTVEQQPTPTLKPSPKPIPRGKIDFTVSQADKTKPQFSQGTIDPYDPPKGGR